MPATAQPTCLHGHSHTTNPTTGLHDTAQETIPVEAAASPEHASWLAKVQLRMAYRGEEVRIFHWDARQE